MNFERRDLLKKAGVGSLALFSASCGWLLYPERKGRQGGEIDLGVLLIDLLWLLPGLVPGVICLAVDFTTGCIYRSGGHSEATPTNEALPDERPALAEVTLDGAVVARSDGSPDQQGRFTLVWERGVDLEEVRQRGQLVVTRRRGASALAPIRDLI